MKKELLKPAAMISALLLLAVYLITLSQTGTAPAISSYFPGILQRQLVYFVLSSCMAFSAVWFYSKRGDTGSWRWCRLIPAGAALIAFFVYRLNNGIIPEDSGEWDVVWKGVSGLVICVCAGLIVIRAVENIRRGVRKWRIALQITAAVILALIAYSVFDSYDNVSFLKPQLLVLPVIFYFLAWEMERAAGHCQRFASLKVPAYFICASVLIVIFFGDFRSYNLVMVVYLVAVAVAALWIMQEETFVRWFWRTEGRRFYRSPWLWTLFMGAGFFLANERFISGILPTWNAPAGPMVVSGGNYERIDFPNWFSYRLTVLKGNLFGSFEYIERGRLEKIALYNSLAWLRHACGIWAAVGVLILLALSFFLLYKCSRGSRLKRFLFGILAISTLIGLAANLLLVFSTPITPLMMDSPCDIAYIWGILLLEDADAEKPEIKPEGRK